LPGEEAAAGGRKPLPARERVSCAAMVVELKIRLKDVRPQVWRKVRVPGRYTLANLHDVIQIAMGWENSHLHQFTIGDVSYTEPTADVPEDLRDERDARLEDFAGAGRKFVYEYDFGDGWKHEIVVERVHRDAIDTVATCVDGRRACPPEDSGGPMAYMRLQRILANPRHREHEDMKDWAGDFDPAAFDLTEVNSRLLRYATPARLRKSRTRRSG
jgi:hypothetical protein